MIGGGALENVLGRRGKRRIFSQPCASNTSFPRRLSSMNNHKYHVAMARGEVVTPS